MATHNRAELLPGLVTALECQKGVASFEAVFVDDCSTDDTAAVLERLAAEASFPLTIMRTERNAGPAAARNLGWRTARAPLIAFTDDDCLPARDWLSAIAAALGQVDLAQGATIAPPEAAGRGPFARTVVIERFSWKFETCNIGYRRSVLEAAAGFDERFAMLGEDCDLAWRALSSRSTAGWAPQAIVVHRVEKTGSRLGDWLATVRHLRRLVFAPLMVKAHPGLRKHLFAHWFYKPHHPLTLLALAGGAGALGRPSGWRARLAVVALVLPWLSYRTAIEPHPAPRRWLWAVLPLGFIADLTAVSATVQGSVRYRTLLL